MGPEGGVHRAVDGDDGPTSAGGDGAWSTRRAAPADSGDWLAGPAIGFLVAG